MRVVRLAAHVRGNNSALTATVLCRSAVLPAAALLGSSAGEAAATASSAAGGNRRRQPVLTTQWQRASASARGAAVSPRVGVGCSGGVQRQQLPRGSWRAWRTDREESARGCLTANTTYYYSLRDINCRQQRHRNSTEGNAPSNVPEAPKCVRWMELCVFHREGEKADNFWENADNLLKSIWDAAAPPLPSHVARRARALCANVRHARCARCQRSARVQSHRRPRCRLARRRGRPA